MVDEPEYTDADAPADEENVAALEITAEQSVLGAMMLNTKVIDDVLAEMLPEDFVDARHEDIARAIAALFHRDAPTDVIAVTDELARAEKLTRVGGAPYLHMLVTNTLTSAGAGYKAHMLHERAVLRGLQVAGSRILAMGSATEGEPAELLDRAHAELDAVTAKRKRGVRPIGASLNEVIDSLGTEPNYLPTPWRGLDLLIGGFAPGGLYVFAGRPGGGKTIAILQAGAGLAHRGLVSFCSLEMTEAELQMRMIAQYGPVALGALRNRKLTDDDKKRVAEARTKMQAAPLYVDDTAGMTLGEIRSHARAVARKGELAGVVVDYLQLVHGEGETRERAVAGVVGGLKQLAKDLNVPVIAAAQLKRAGMRKTDLPTMEDLRESGSIEQDADCVILLHRDPKAPDVLKMIVAKNRHGESGEFTVRWQGQYARLMDLSYGQTPLFD